MLFQHRGDDEQRTRLSIPSRPAEPLLDRVVSRRFFQQMGRLFGHGVVLGDSSCKDGVQDLGQVRATELTRKLFVNSFLPLSDGTEVMVTPDAVSRRHGPLFTPVLEEFLRFEAVNASLEQS